MKKLQSLPFLAILALVIGMISWGSVLNAQSTPSTTPDTAAPQQTPKTQPTPSSETPPASQQAPNAQQPPSQTPPRYYSSGIGFESRLIQRSDRHPDVLGYSGEAR